MMNKTEFLAALRRELGFLPKDELDDAIRYYENISMTPEMTKRK